MEQEKRKLSIQTVSIVGLGALGVMYARFFSERLPQGKLRVVADRPRIKKYQREGVYCNGQPCDFHYVASDLNVEPADLVLFCVKFGALPQAIEDARKQIGSNTIILSALNGISSEEIIGEAYGMDKLLYCVAQGMDAAKDGNRLQYHNMGKLCFGEKDNTHWSDKVKTVADFFDRCGFAYEVPLDMEKRMWGKFMLNVGVNQTCAVFATTFGGVLAQGEPRETMINAMKEVLLLSQKAGVLLTESDIAYWIQILDGLNPLGKPSMLQDIEAKRKTEVELFSGTVIALGKKHRVPTPVNEFLYQKIQELEKAF